jgi:hypothetical protein
MAWNICACEIFLTAFPEGLRISRKNGQEKIDFAALFLSFLILSTAPNPDFKIGVKSAAQYQP